MDKKRLVELLTEAVEAEDRSYARYSRLAEECGDPELKVILTRLAKEELEHGRTIKRRLEIFKDYS